MKARHPFIAFLLNAFAQRIYQPAPGAHQFKGATAEKQAKGRKAGAYGRGLANQFARQQRDRMALKDLHPLEDDHGAYTMTGRPKRTWLAGVSAQRGY